MKLDEGTEHADLVAGLIALGWRSGKVITSTVLASPDDVGAHIMVFPRKEDRYKYAVHVGDPDKQLYGAAEPRTTAALKMASRDAREVARVLAALGIIPEVQWSPRPGRLTWLDAGTDDPVNQEAVSQRDFEDVWGAYYDVSRDHDRFLLTLVAHNDLGGDANKPLGSYESPEDARAGAQRYEDTGELPNN